MADGDGRDHRDPERTQAVYDEIADHFAETRAYPWPEVEAFLDGVDGAGVALDIGCGNGRHTALLADCAERAVGFDISRELLATASGRMAEDGWRADLLQGDAATLPLRSECVDVAVYVATVHHLPDRESRVASLRELARVLDGRALVSAWSTAHDRFEAHGGSEPEGFDTTVDWTLPGGETVERFYHIYAPEEFEADLRAAGLSVAEAFVSSGNCYAEVSA
ncbi:methyltransferase domain-containing protein [Halovenus sp. WSH3]|uniref:Methyltransferase domain-containing protein n=1 Tax=Halovenus carboxidivorans TaxID=2692199 RepID=A0A6B0T0F1_9EURY|nr:class I SAM-dependent methyltransferase [Halovenus carboxidivorans]MXR51648.1 methyltransferase domain-containing protein [Halovenus carboxidivorans]